MHESCTARPERTTDVSLHLTAKRLHQIKKKNRPKECEIGVARGKQIQCELADEAGVKQSD